MAEQNSYIVRGNDICFGLDGVTVPWGVVTSVKRKPSRSSEKFVGESGNTESVVYWDPRRQTGSKSILPACAPDWGQGRI